MPTDRSLTKAALFYSTLPCQVRDGFHYDVVVKTRDNTLAVAPLVITWRHARGPTLSKRCVEWGGYNDKASQAWPQP